MLVLASAEGRDSSGLNGHCGLVASYRRRKGRSAPIESTGFRPTRASIRREKVNSKKDKFFSKWIPLYFLSVRSNPRH